MTPVCGSTPAYRRYDLACSTGSYFRLGGDPPFSGEFYLDTYLPRVSSGEVSHVTVNVSKIKIKDKNFLKINK